MSVSALLTTIQKTSSGRYRWGSAQRQQAARNRRARNRGGIGGVENSHPNINSNNATLRGAARAETKRRRQQGAAAEARARAEYNAARAASGGGGRRVWIRGFYRTQARGNRVWVRGHWQEGGR